MIVIFNYIKGFFTTITDMLTAIANLIFVIIELLGKCFSFLFDVISVLPTAFTVSFVALVAIAIIYKLLGREAGN